MQPEKSLADAEQAHAAEEAKRRQAEAATRRLGRLEQENHLAHLFRQAFSGR